MDKLLKINNKLVKSENYIVCIKDTPVDPYNPLGLPANTVRVRTSNGNAPVKGDFTSYQTATLVPGTSDVYDVFKDGQSFQDLLQNSNNVVEVLGANTTGITNMRSMFGYCTSLTTVPLFDTSNITEMYGMFYNCTSLTSVPLFNTTKVTSITVTFYGCTSVQSGALALYQQASTQANPPTGHLHTFYNCGSNTQTGAAELAQIPSSFPVHSDPRTLRIPGIKAISFWWINYTLLFAAFI